MLIVHDCIMWSWDRTPWLFLVLKYFLFLDVLSTLSFILWYFCLMALLSIFAFLCLPTWSHDENVDCPPLYHVIMGSYTLTVGVLKYFLFLGVLSALSFILWCFCPMALLSIFTFLCLKNVIAWRECWLSTPVSCDHGIVHLDCWSIKIFSLFGRFVHLSFILWAFVLWRFCPFLLFSVRPRDPMTNMLIVHPYIMWSWDRTPWMLEY